MIEYQPDDVGLFQARSWWITLCCEKPTDAFDATHPPKRAQRIGESDSWHEHGFCVSTKQELSLWGNQIGSHLHFVRRNTAAVCAAIGSAPPEILLAVVPNEIPPHGGLPTVEVWFQCPRGILDLLQWPEGFPVPKTSDELRVAADWHEEQGNHERRDTFRDWATLFDEGGWFNRCFDD